VVEACRGLVSKKLLREDESVLVVSRSRLGKHVGSLAGIYNVAKVLKKREKK